MNLKEDFAAFATTAIRMGGHLLEGMSAEQEAAVNRGLEAGSRLCLEFGPLPHFQELRLILIEPEGTRHLLTTISVTTPSALQ